MSLNKLIMKTNFTTKTFAYLLLKGYQLAFKKKVDYLLNKLVHIVELILITNLLSAFYNNEISHKRSYGYHNFLKLTSSTTLNKALLLLTLLGLGVGEVMGQTTYYFQPESGNPVTLSNWNTAVAGGGTSPANFSGATDVFIIPSGKTATGTSAWTVTNQVTVRGTLNPTSSSNNYTAKTWVIESGANVNITDGASVVTSSGTFTCAGTVTKTGSGLLTLTSSSATFNNGGTYYHNNSASNANIPTATWETGSTCHVRYTGTAAWIVSNYAQEFYNLIWDWWGFSSTNYIFEASPPTFKTGGTFTLRNSRGYLALSESITSTRTWDVQNFVIEGGTFRVGVNRSPAHTMTINGFFKQTGGSFFISADNSVGTPPAVPTLNVNGDFEFSGGTFGNVRVSYSILNFNGNTTYKGTTAFNGVYIRVNVKNGATLSVPNGNFLSGGFNSITGFVQFNIESGATFQVGDANGFVNTAYDNTSTKIGAIRMNGTKSYSTSANYIYQSGVAQVTGNGLPATVNNLTIDNSHASGVSLTNNVTVSNTLGLSNGQLNLNSNTLTLANNANIIRSGGSLSAIPSFGASVNVTYNQHSGSITTGPELPTAPTVLNNITVNNTNGVNLNANSTVNGNLTVNNSGVLNLGANTLNRGSAGGTLTLGDNTTLRIGGTGTFPINYNTHNIATTSTVNYNGANQEVALLNSSQSYGNLTLSGSGTKTFAHATDTNIGGNFTVEGVTVTTPTRLNFNGSSSQSIAGLAYNNIAFSNAGTKTFTSNALVSPTSEITFSGTPGTVDFDGTGDNLEFVLQSSVNGTARLGNTTGWTLNGQLRAERFLPAKRAWRLLTAPLKGNANNSIYANWQGTTNEGLLLWHPQGGGNTGLAVGPQSNIWSYTGTGWASVTNTNTTNLYDGSTNNAYLVFATGSFGSQNISSGADATTIRAKGALITGDKEYSLVANQFKLIGNPYASPINTEVMVSDPANSGSKIWLLDPTNGLGAYVTYDGSNWSVPTPSGNDKYIQSGQAFFIRSNSNSFTVKESHKVVGNSNTWFERNANNQTNLENSDRIRVLLYKQDTNNWLFADGALAVNSSSGNNNVDDTDATKISNFNESLFLRNGTTNLSIEYRALPQLGDIQPLRLTGTTNGSYQLRLYTENYTNSTIQPYLEDTQTTSIYQIPTDGSEIIVPFEGVVSNSSNPITRFRLVYQSTLDTQDPTKIGVNIYPNPVDQGYLNISLDNNLSATTYALTNLLGQEVQSGNLMLLDNVINVSKIPNGVYFITIKQNEKNYSKKIIIN